MYVSRLMVKYHVEVTVETNEFNIRAFSVAVFFKKSGLILSGPGDLLESQFANRFNTPCRVISILTKGV